MNDVSTPSHQCFQKRLTVSAHSPSKLLIMLDNIKYKCSCPIMTCPTHTAQEYLVYFDFYKKRLFLKFLYLHYLQLLYYIYIYSHW